jgi:hypothetical protein
MSADAVRQKPIRQVELPLRRWLLKSMSETAFWRLKPDVPLSADSVEKLCLSPFISTDSILVLRGD